MAKKKNQKNHTHIMIPPHSVGMAIIETTNNKFGEDMGGKMNPHTLLVGM
jgi:hypothetical protein